MKSLPTFLFKKRIIFILFLMGVLLSNHSISQQINNLYVLDPQMWWNRTPGVIHEAKLVVIPAGTYVNYDLYLTISAVDGYYSSQDTLEFVLDFELPDRSIFHDSWLWFEDTILIAEIMDRWTANAIYESIVQRNQDPSILFKESNVQYQLRVFPMAGHESRSLKISWLQPVNWSQSGIAADIPLHLLKTTSGEFPNLDIYVNTDDWGIPFFYSLPEKEFTLTTNPDFTGMFHARIQESEYAAANSISFQSQMNQGVFLNTYTSDEENLYQFVLIPSLAFDISDRGKVLVMVDYDKEKTTFSRQNILMILQEALQGNLTESDSFNIILSGLNPYRVSNQWLPANQTTIDSVFAELSSSSVSNNSYLSQLLVDGFNFMSANENDGVIVLLAASDSYGRSTEANKLINDIKNDYGIVPTIHVVDLNDKNITSIWQGGGTYYGNEYFYTLLTRQSGGNLYSISAGTSIHSALSKSLQSIGHPLSIYDMYATVEDGFCYGRINPTPLGQTTYTNRPIVQLGKYYGNLPFQLQFSGLYRNQPFTQTISIDSSYAISADTLLNKIWTGNFIADLERSGSSNEIISEIISYSLENRILSLYTAFLALEPGLDIDPDELDNNLSRDNWWREDGWFVVGESPKNEEVILSVNVYPNPFSSNVTIEVNLPSELLLHECSIDVYNMLGLKIKSFNPNEYGFGNRVVINWDGIELPTGSYLVVVRTRNEVKTLKMIKR